MDAAKDNVTVILILSLVAGLVIFILVAILVALVFRWKARKRGEWTVGSIRGRRGDGGGVATDNNESALREFMSTIFANSLKDLDDEPVVGIDDPRPSSASLNGHAFSDPSYERTIFRDPAYERTIFRVDAVIEHRSDPTYEVVADTDVTVNKDNDVAEETGLEHEGCYITKIKIVSTKADNRDRHNRESMHLYDEINDVK